MSPVCNQPPLKVSAVCSGRFQYCSMACAARTQISPASPCFISLLSSSRRVTALVVAKPGARPVPEALMQLVKDRKGGPHAPKQVEFVETLPLTAVGKVDKKVLRAKYWAGRERMVG